MHGKGVFGQVAGLAVPSALQTVVLLVGRFQHVVTAQTLWGGGQETERGRDSKIQGYASIEDSYMVIFHEPRMA